MTYDSWKTTEPDRDPVPGEHRPYDDECDCDGCMLAAGVCPECGSTDTCECDDGPLSHLEEEDLARAESDYEDCP